MNNDAFSGVVVLGILHSTSSYSAIIEKGSSETKVFALGFPFAPRKGPPLADVANKLGCKVRVSLVYPEIQQAVQENKIEVIPMNWSMSHRFIQKFLKSRKRSCAICTISRPNESGLASFGCDSAYAGLMVDAADFAIGEINPHQPNTLGESLVNTTKFSAMIETEEELPLLPEPKVGRVQQKIGEYVSELVEDRSTIQLGLGSVPQAVSDNLTNKNDLGFHSGLLTDSVATLIDQGIINNKFKEVSNGKSVTCLAFGFHPSFYKWLDLNEKVEMRPTSFTHDRSLIGSMSRFVAINSAIQVDLFGQVNAETLGGTQISGVGGQMDFNIGARLSRGGKSIIALESTTRNSSKIVPLLNKNEIVTTCRSEVDYVVTEYGIAELEGKTRKERAISLIEIAHPDFRQELRAHASELSLL